MAEEYEIEKAKSFAGDCYGFEIGSYSRTAAGGVTKPTLIWTTTANETTIEVQETVHAVPPILAEHCDVSTPSLVRSVSQSSPAAAAAAAGSGGDSTTKNTSASAAAAASSPAPTPAKTTRSRRSSTSSKSDASASTVDADGIVRSLRRSYRFAFREREIVAVYTDVSGVQFQQIQRRGSGKQQPVTPTGDKKSSAVKSEAMSDGENDGPVIQHLPPEGMEEDAPPTPAALTAGGGGGDGDTEMTGDKSTKSKSKSKSSKSKSTAKSTKGKKKKAAAGRDGDETASYSDDSEPLASKLKKKASPLKIKGNKKSAAATAAPQSDSDFEAAPPASAAGSKKRKAASPSTATAAAAGSSPSGGSDKPQRISDSGAIVVTDSDEDGTTKKSKTDSKSESSSPAANKRLKVLSSADVPASPAAAVKTEPATPPPATNGSRRRSTSTAAAAAAASASGGGGGGGGATRRAAKLADSTSHARIVIQFAGPPSFERFTLMPPSGNKRTAASNAVAADEAKANGPAAAGGGGGGGAAPAPAASPPPPPPAPVKTKPVKMNRGWVKCSDVTGEQASTKRFLTIYTSEKDAREFVKTLGMGVSIRSLESISENELYWHTRLRRYRANEVARTATVSVTETTPLPDGPSARRLFYTALSDSVACYLSNFVTAKQLLVFSGVNRHFYNLFRKDRLWKQFYAAKNKVLTSELENGQYVSWCEKFFTMQSILCSSCGERKTNSTAGKILGLIVCRECAKTYAEYQIIPRTKLLSEYKGRVDVNELESFRKAVVPNPLHRATDCTYYFVDDLQQLVGFTAAQRIAIANTQ